MTKLTTPKADGFWMPAEFAPQDRIWMIWPQRGDNWRSGAQPVQQCMAKLAQTIALFTPVTMCASDEQYDNCRLLVGDTVQVMELSADDSWSRDTGPTFVINGKGELRGCDWKFNSWGGLVDGLFFPWDHDDRVAEKLCQMAGAKSYRTEDFVLEGGSFHVDGEGTVLTTEMCLLSPGRNPHLTKSEIETYLKNYLGIEKVLWLKRGIDPEETNGHVDDVVCFARPGEVICIHTDDEAHPFYEVAQECYKDLSTMVDANGRTLKVHKLCCTKNPVTIQSDFVYDGRWQSKKRTPGEMCIASYANFLITNGGIIVPQYGDPNDSLAIAQLEAIFPEHTVVGVPTVEIVYGGGNIHCMTQQQPAP